MRITQSTVNFMPVASYCSLCKATANIASAIVVRLQLAKATSDLLQWPCGTGTLTTAMHGCRRLQRTGQQRHCRQWRGMPRQLLRHSIRSDDHDPGRSGHRLGCRHHPVHQGVCCSRQTCRSSCALAIRVCQSADIAGFLDQHGPAETPQVSHAVT